MILLTLLISCNSKKNISTSVEPPPQVNIQLVSKVEANEKLILIGQIHGEKEIIIYPAITISGIIRNVHVDESSQVNQGAPLMEIDQQAVTGNQFNRFIVRAKIKGIISHVYVQNGDSVSPQTKLCQIVQMKKVKVTIDIPEREIGKVKMGQTVDIFTQSYPKKPFKGRLTRLHPSVDPKTLTLRGEVIIKNTADLKLKPGMFVQTEILLNKKAAILIPLNAMIIEDNVRYVYVYESISQTVSRRVIRTGNYYGTKIEVTYGLNVGDHLVTAGQYQVTDQDKVRVKKDSNISKENN